MAADIVHGIDSKVYEYPEGYHDRRPVIMARNQDRRELVAVGELAVVLQVAAITTCTLRKRV